MKYWFFLFFFLLLPISVKAASISQRTAGYILLDVQNHGEAWYVNPVNLERYYLADGAAAFQLMSSLGLGISNTDLAQIPVAGGSQTSDWSIRSRLAGRILLQVEEHGEAWYVHPESLQRYYLGRPETAYEVMRFQSLGITSSDLKRISIAQSKQNNLESYIQLNFTSQAPFGDWSDKRQAEGCEEASVLMAVKWARGETFTLVEARDAIVAMSDWEKVNWGYYYDTSAEDTAERLIKTYYGFTNYSVVRNISTNDIREELKNGHLVVVPINGQTIGNPYYTGAGPLRHMIVINGFDFSTSEFIAQDPGTSHGVDLRFSEDRLAASLRDYTSGEYAPIGNLGSAMIV
ncbi:C39 family peptidase, partial [Patescibacteria group bacterium]|nr:C39 family peptidase [Patescibacteria group bacterium]